MFRTLWNGALRKGVTVVWNGICHETLPDVFALKNAKYVIKLKPNANN